MQVFGSIWLPTISMVRHARLTCQKGENKQGKSIRIKKSETNRANDKKSENKKTKAKRAITKGTNDKKIAKTKGGNKKSK